MEPNFLDKEVNKPADSASEQGAVPSSNNPRLDTDQSDGSSGKVDGRANDTNSGQETDGDVKDESQNGGVNNEEEIDESKIQLPLADIDSHEVNGIVASSEYDARKYNLVTSVKLQSYPIC